MAYRTPTARNREVGAQLTRRIAQRLVDTYTDGLRPAHALGQRETVPPAEAVAALEHLRAQRRQAEALIFDLLGSVVLTGISVGHVAEVTGVGHSTLTRRLRRTPAAMRGFGMEPDPLAPHGWRALT